MRSGGKNQDDEDDSTILDDAEETIIVPDEQNPDDATVLATEDSGEETLLAEEADDADATMLVDDETVILTEGDETVISENTEPDTHAGDETLLADSSGEGDNPALKTKEEKTPSDDETLLSVKEDTFSTPTSEKTVARKEKDNGSQFNKSEAPEAETSEKKATTSASPLISVPEYENIPEIDGVEIEHFLGMGAAGAVYLARQRLLSRKCALKVLHEALGRKAGFRRSFHREGQVLAQMDHPNIVRVYDVGERKGIYFLLLEYVDSGDLLDHLQTAGGALEPEEVKNIFIEILDALRYAHGKQIVHCDLKPQNILRTIDGRIKISDFGIAKVIGETSGGSGKAEPEKVKVEGTPDYMAPEMKTGAKPSIKSDLYAVGVMMYYLLCGKKPKGDYLPASKVRKHIHPKWDQLIAQCLAEDPANRISSARNALNLLREIPVEKKSFPWVKAGALFLALSLGLTGYFYYNNLPEKDEAGKEQQEDSNQLKNGGLSSLDESDTNITEKGSLGGSSDQANEVSEKIQSAEVLAQPVPPQLSAQELLSQKLPNQKINLYMALHNGKEVLKRSVFLSNEAFGWQFKASEDAKFILLSYLNNEVHLVFPEPGGQPGFLAKNDLVSSPPVEPEPPYGMEETVQIVVSSNESLLKDLLMIFDSKSVVTADYFRNHLLFSSQNWNFEAASSTIRTGSRSLNVKTIDAYHQQPDN